MSTITDLLSKLVTLSGPCPNVCDEGIPLGGSGGTQVVDIITGEPVTEYPPQVNSTTFRECCMTMSGSPFASGSTLDPTYYEYYNTAEITTNEYNFSFCTGGTVIIEVTITSNIPWPPVSGVPPMVVWVDSVSYNMTEGVTQSITINQAVLSKIGYGQFSVSLGNNANEDFDVNILVENVTCGASQIINVVNFYAP